MKFLVPFFLKNALFGQYQMLPKFSRLNPARKNVLTWSITHQGYPFILWKTCFRWLSSFSYSASFEQTMYALLINQLNVPCFQMVGVNEFQCRYKSSCAFFLQTVVLRLSPSLTSKTSENGKVFFAVFSIWKSLRVLQKAHIKIVAHAIYNYLFFSCRCILPFCWKIKSCCDHYFTQQIRPQTTDQ